MTSVPLDHAATYEDLRALPPDVRAEILDGELIVVPSATPRHNRMTNRLLRDVDEAAEPHGFAALADVDVLWPGTDQVTRPDVLVVTADVAEGTDLPVREVPVVVVEVLSPDSAGRDLVKKPRIAAAAGVPEYWVVDPESREIYRHVLVEGRYEVQVVAPGEECAVETLPFPYTLRPAVLEPRHPRT